MLKHRKWTADDGTSIWYATDGRGPTMVLCDGIGCDGYIWPYILDHFDERFTFVRWHYRGHGNSGEPTDPQRVSIQDSCGDLHAILHHLEQEGTIQLPAVLVGHSMGVQVILEYAHTYPDDVRALVPICGSPGLPLDTFRDSDAFKTVLLPLLAAVERAPNLAQVLWQKAFHNPLSWVLATRTEVNPELVRRADFMPYLKHMGRVRIETFLRMLRHVAEHDARPFLHEIDVPVLVMAGAFDNFTPMHLSEEMVRALPQAELLVMPEGSHTAPLEMPDLLNTELERFIQAHHLDAPAPRIPAPTLPLEPATAAPAR